MEGQKKIIQISDQKTIKVFKKPFTKKILDCFDEKPKTAGEIANSISFPKEKIYYHIKKLISSNLLYVTSTEMVKGIEQKLFYPTAKEYTINDNEAGDNKKDSDRKGLQKDNVHRGGTKNSINDLESRIERERREKNDRREIGRRNILDRRNKTKENSVKDERRIGKDRRTLIDQRVFESRRNKIKRNTVSHNIKDSERKTVINQWNGQKSLPIKNTLLKLNGIKRAMTFVQSNNHVTFLLCNLKKEGFEIERINNYVLPFKVKDYEINTLTDLIVNVSNQFISNNKRQKVYLAVQSDNYQLQMIYASVKGKNKKLFEKGLLNTLNDSYDFKDDHSLFDYVINRGHEKSATVCISNKRDQIIKDYSDLIDAGLQPRYNTSIPQILKNLHAYYNLNHESQFSLLIYIDREKTYIVFLKEGELLDSKEITKGLNYFADALVELTIINSTDEEAKENALHFLSHYGLSPETSDSSIQDGIPFKKAKSILDHLSLGFLNEIKESIYYFEKVILHDGFSEDVVGQIFTCGVGSHIKNLNNYLQQELRIEVKNISDFNSAFLKDSDKQKGPLIKRLRSNGLFKKRESRETQLEGIKKSINQHEKAIESAQSPESAKYRLTRIEMEKDSKLKSIESASQKLLGASKEFKQIKDEYLSGQDGLKSDLSSVTSLLEEHSSVLIEKYKEHEEIINTISELEYEHDRSKNKEDKERQQIKGEYQSRVKIASRSRAKLGDEKESLDQDIDNLESTIINLEESLHDMNQKIENGKDEVTVFEYLKDSIQATANAFKRSFLDHLKVVENLTTEDLNTLQRSGYLLTQNTKRIDEIKESFQATISGENTNPNKIIDGDDGIDVREKLLKILNLVLEAPDNLIHLKNLTGSIIKINESQREMLSKHSDIERMTRQAKRTIKGNQKTLTSLNREIDVHEKEVLRKVNDRQEELDLLKYIRNTIDQIQDLQHHSMLIKELNPQKRMLKSDLEDIESRMTRLNTLIESCENAHEGLEIEQAELEKSFQQDKKFINDKISSLEDEEKQKKSQLDHNSLELDKISKEISDGSIYIEQLEKQVIDKRNEIENINKEKTPIVKTFEADREKLISKFNGQLKKIDQEEERKKSEAKKSKSITIETYFNKELTELNEKSRLLDKSFKRASRDRDRFKLEREKAHSSLSSLKKKNNPKIASLKKQIHNLQKDLNQGRRFQERLDRLEHQKGEWDSQLRQEKKNINGQINQLEKTIERKNSESYLVFLKDGLSRFKNDGDVDLIAQSMADESISLDKEEVRKLKSDLALFVSRYEQFMAKYRKSYRDVMTKLRPYGGRKSTILKRINTSKDKIQKLESMIQAMVDKVDKKNEQFIESQNTFDEINKSINKDRSEINTQIENIPNKKQNAITDIQRRLEERLQSISNKRLDVEGKRDKEIKSLEKSFKSQELIQKLIKAEDRVLYFFSEIEKTKEKIEFLLQQKEKVGISRASLEKRIVNIFKKHDTEQLRISEIEKQFNNEKINLSEKIDLNRSEFSILNDQLVALDKERDDISGKYQKIEKDYQASNDLVKDLKKNIKVPYDSKKKKTRPNRKEQLRYLIQMEKDMMVTIERTERMIKDLNILVDSMSNERSEIQSSISVLENDLEFYDTDSSRIMILIDNNKEHLVKLSTDHRKALNGISNVKELYPASKIMLNDRITNLYTNVELKAKNRDTLDGQLNELQDQLKNKRVESAMMDQELAKINEEMKIALESSFFEQDDKSKDWKWEIADQKMSSYMDIAQLKVQSKVIFKSIEEIEQEISKLKNQKSSINNVINEKERTSHKKIKQMEEVCTRLELQITREKNELDGLEEEVKQLTGFAFNYGDRIDVLEQELKNFREKQTEYELELIELDRSLESIQDKSDKILNRKRSIKENSIQIDYMANLGLLMDPDQKLNILPKDHKKEYKYFRPNQVLQNAILVLLTIFSIGSLAQRSKIEPLESMISVKQSEISLLNMRQEMKDIVTSKNLIANAFSKLVKDDKEISRSMVSTLKYLSQSIPMDFKVTDITIDKTQATDVPDILESNTSQMSISIDGFFEHKQKKAFPYAQKLIKTLKDTKSFESVDIVEEKETSFKNTRYKIRITR